MTGSPGTSAGWRGRRPDVGRTTTRLLRSGVTVAMRSVMAVDGATITSERRAARCTTTALRWTEARLCRVEPGLFAFGEEVHRTVQQSPPLAARGDKTYIIERYSPTPGRAAQLPAQQPAWPDPPSRTDDLDILPFAALEVAVQLNQEPSGAAHQRPGHVHGHCGGHRRTSAWPASSANEWSARRDASRSSADLAPSIGHDTRCRPAEPRSNQPPPDAMPLPQRPQVGVVSAPRQPPTAPGWRPHHHGQSLAKPLRPPDRVPQIGHRSLRGITTGRKPRQFALRIPGTLCHSWSLFEYNISRSVIELGRATLRPWARV